MVKLNRWNRFVWKNDFFKRIFSIQKSLKKIRKGGPHSKIVLGVSLITFSLILGIYAYETSKNEALSEWERSHPPSLSIWKSLLKAHHYSQITQTQRIEKLYRSLPVSLEETPILWVDPTQNWIALNIQDFFCIICTSFPRQWESRINNWNTYFQIEKQIYEVQAKPTARKKPKNHDPREIRY